MRGIFTLSTWGSRIRSKDVALRNHLADGTVTGQFSALRDNPLKKERHPCGCLSKVSVKSGRLREQDDVARVRSARRPECRRVASHAQRIAEPRGRKQFHVAVGKEHIAA